MFDNRTKAGKLLTDVFTPFLNTNAVILGLARGGVPVAYQISKGLNLPLEVFIVRKLGVPGQPELAFGAIAEDGIVVLDDRLTEMLDLPLKEMMNIAEKEKAELERRTALYRKSKEKSNMHDKTVILVDDGLATGLSMKAAVKSILLQAPKKVVVAVPVASDHGVDRVQKELRYGVDEVVCLTVRRDFESVGQYYRNFPQVSDEEVVKLIN